MIIKSETEAYTTLSIKLSTREAHLLKNMMRHGYTPGAEEPEVEQIRRQIFSALSEPFIPLVDVLDNISKKEEV